MLTDIIILDKRNNIAPENQKPLMERTIMARLGAFLLTVVILFGSFGSSFEQLSTDTSSSSSIGRHDGQFDHASTLSQESEADAAHIAVLSLAEKSETDEDEAGLQSISSFSGRIVPTLSLCHIDFFTSCILIEAKKYILYHSLKIPF